MILNRETIWSDLCLTKSSHAMEDGLDGELWRQGETIRTPLQLVSSERVQTWTKAISGGMERRGAIYRSGSAFYRDKAYISR